MHTAQPAGVAARSQSQRASRTGAQARAEAQARDERCRPHSRFRRGGTVAQARVEHTGAAPALGQGLAVRRQRARAGAGTRAECARDPVRDLWLAAACRSPRPGRSEPARAGLALTRALAHRHGGTGPLVL